MRTIKGYSGNQSALFSALAWICAFISLLGLVGLSAYSAQPTDQRDWRAQGTWSGLSGYYCTVEPGSVHGCGSCCGSCSSCIALARATVDAKFRLQGAGELFHLPRDRHLSIYLGVPGCAVAIIQDGPGKSDRLIEA